ncbi:MAG: FHA domain-containing protein [Prevotellaceae bacterium]|nr:FHA domain-containing protein [Prevotellaceae bacterium]
MKQHIILLCGMIVCFGVQAQNVKTENFPEISFVWNEYGTEQYTKSYFSLKEDGRNVPFEVVIQKSEKTKNVLFLWEDMASHSGQYDTFKQVLTSFLGSAVGNGDKFNVLVFNRRPFNGKAGENYRLLTNGFVSANELLGNINSYQRSTAHYSQQDVAADLYASIEDALKYLSEDKSRDKMLVLMTAGLNVSVSGATKERAPLEDEARKAGIPIYAVYYPYQGNSHVPAYIQGIAENTGGKVIVADNPVSAADALSGYDAKLDTRSYSFTFTTQQKRDGKPHEIVLQHAGGKSETLTFTAPNMTLSVWIKENVRLFIGLVAAFIAIVVLVVILWVNHKKKKEAEIRANLENVRQEAEAKTSAARQEAERVRQEQIAYQQKQEREKQIATVQAEQERLAGLMQAKNLFPRLQCSVAGNNFTYNINKPVTTLGRKGHNNDVELDNDKVSRHHAEIVFTGGGFEIIDKGSTNKVIVNGQFFERATLKNGDIIGLGEAVITFYV